MPTDPTATVATVHACQDAKGEQRPGGFCAACADEAPRPRMTRLHRWVAGSGYAWPRFAVFMFVRLVEIAALLVVLRAVLRWGFDV